MTTAWQQRYADKIRTAQQAVAAIERGQRVFISSACGEPQELVRALGRYDSKSKLLELLGHVSHRRPVFLRHGYQNRPAHWQ